MLKRWPFYIVSLVISISLLYAPTAEAATTKQPSTSRSAAIHSRGSSQQEYSQAFATDPKLKHLQQLLAKTGFYPGAMTGVFDKATQDAIVWAQKYFKLNPTGKYDQKLADALTREVLKKPNTYRKKLSMQATAYTSQDPGSGNLTKREHRLRPGLVAVDPKVIPLGTRLYIEGYGYAIADDIGSAIKGAKIDLAYENRKEALTFGRKMVTVFILD